MVKTVTETVIQTFGSVPWVGVAIQAVAMLGKTAAQAKLNKTEQQNFHAKVDELTSSLTKLKAELYADGGQEVSEGDDAQLLLLKRALKLVETSFQFQQHVSAKGFWAALRACVCANRHASTLAGLVADINRLLPEIQLEVIEHISEVTRNRILHPSSAAPEMPAHLGEGLGEVTQSVMTFLQAGGVRVVGVHGQGGIGKTTLLRAVHVELIQHKTHEIAFVEVGMQPSSLIDLQRDVVSQLSRGTQLQFSTTAQGRTELKQCFEKLKPKRKVCIILDNVWQTDHLHELLPHREELLAALPDSSYLLISSRSADVAKTLYTMCSRSDKERGEVYLEQEVKALPTVRARKLFDEWALSRKAPLLPQHEQFVNKIVKLCDGLPLALRVYGAYFSDEEKRRRDDWNRVIKSLEAAEDLPTLEERVFARLKTSVELLTPELQEAFVMVALVLCRYPLDIGLNFFEDTYIMDDLRDRSLVNYEDVHNAFASRSTLIPKVHDTYVALATKIVNARQEEYIHSVNMVEHLLHRSQDLSRIRACVLSLYPFSYGGNSASLVEKLLFECSQLRFLHIEGFEGSFPLCSGLFNDRCNELLALIFRKSAISIPHWMLQLPKLGVLILEECLTKAEDQLPKTLRVLGLRARGEGCQIPNSIQYMMELKSLSLIWFSNVTEIPTWISRLGSLQTLCLDQCSFRTLPGSFGSLSSLQTLKMTTCVSLKALSGTLGSLGSLQTLHLSECYSLSALPQTLGSLGSLQTLYLSGCSSLSALPQTLGSLGSLQTLALSLCSSLSALPETLGSLGSLQTLDLSWCTSLSALPETLGSLGSLQTLVVSWCASLSALPKTLGSLGSLQTLDLSGCTSLSSLPKTLGSLGSLQTLGLSGCSSLSSLPETLGFLGSLQSLDLSNCTSLSSLPETLGALGSLQSLDLKHCSSLSSLPETTGSLGSLQSLDLKHCSSLSSLPENLGSLGSLQSLDVDGCSSLLSLPESLGSLGSLGTLLLQGCSSLSSLSESLGSLGSLHNLGLWQCSSLSTLPESLGSLSSLQTLRLWQCSSLLALPESLGSLSSLQTLDLLEWTSLSALPESLCSLSSLHKLFLKQCSSLLTLPGKLGSLSSLHTLDLRQCSSLAALPENLGSLSSLHTLDLRQCSSLAALPESLGSLSSLQILDLRECSSLAALPGSLGTLSSLQTLVLRQCSSFLALPESLSSLSSLQTLDLWQCSSLSALPESLGSLSSLQTLNLLQCSSLLALPESLSALSSLRTLDLRQCSSLSVLPESLGSLPSLKIFT